MAHLYLGIDVGTGSARAGLFDETGKMHGMGVSPIQTWKPQEDFVEQSSDDIWRACGVAVREALTQARAKPQDVKGIGFDATCSLVALGADDRPVTVSPTGQDEQNVIVWMDHRAQAQADRINAGKHDVLRYVGGVISPEMETPKLAWLKENLGATWERAAKFFDLPDFLAYRATGVDVRSLCTTVCKWTYRGDESRWDASYFDSVGLGDLAANDWAKIGTKVRPMGELQGKLTAAAAADLGLVAGIPVGVAIIDAHAGGIGMLGIGSPSTEDLETRVALIGGTSTCHMAVSREPKWIPGIWGPYFSAMVPGLWLTEGGQSATGALIDQTIFGHARGAELREQAEREGSNVHILLKERLDKLAKGRPIFGLTEDLHVLPDHHGNRSPRADATLRGMVSGLKLSDSADALALLYLATIQGIALGTRHILDAMRAKGYAPTTLVACGGDTKNPIFLRAHADATGCRIMVPEEQEAVLLGAAILGAVASGHRPSVLDAMGKMARAGRTVRPDPDTAGFYDQKYRVMMRMHDDQLAYREIMSEAPDYPPPSIKRT
jgi:FGGY-family pentulose kinase